MKLRQKVVFDIAYINKAEKIFFSWDIFSNAMSFSQLDSQLACLGMWVEEVYSYLTQNKNAMVLHLASGICRAAELIPIVEEYQGLLSKEALDSVNLFFKVEPKLRALISKSQQDSRIGKFKFLVDGIDNDKAVQLLQRAVDAGLLDQRFQPLPETSRGEQKVIAFAVGQMLELPNRGRWLPFDKLWPYKDKNLSSLHLPQVKNDGIKSVMSLYPEVDFSGLLQKKKTNLYFYSRNTQKSIEYLYNSLKNEKYISENTTYSQFCSIFANQKGREPIVWLKAQSSLGYFIYNAFAETNEKIWTITQECFTINGKPPHRGTLCSFTSKVIRQKRVIDARLLEIAEHYKNSIK